MNSLMLLFSKHEFAEHCSCGWQRERSQSILDTLRILLCWSASIMWITIERSCDCCEDSTCFGEFEQFCFDLRLLGTACQCSVSCQRGRTFSQNTKSHAQNAWLFQNIGNVWRDEIPTNNCRMDGVLSLAIGIHWNLLMDSWAQIALETSQLDDVLRR